MAKSGRWPIGDGKAGVCLVGRVEVIVGVTVLVGEGVRDGVTVTGTDVLVSIGETGTDRPQAASDKANTMMSRVLGEDRMLSPFSGKPERLPQVYKKSPTSQTIKTWQAIR